MIISHYAGPIFFALYSQNSYQIDLRVLNLGFLISTNDTIALTENVKKTVLKEVEKVLDEYVIVINTKTKEGNYKYL